MSCAITPTDRRRPQPNAVPVRACRDCGCTDTTACLGGCHWVESNLCSACLVQKRATLTRAAQVREVVAGGGRILRAGHFLSLVDAEGHEIPAWQTALAKVSAEKGR